MLPIQIRRSPTQVASNPHQSKEWYQYYIDEGSTGRYNSHEQLFIPPSLMKNSSHNYHVLGEDITPEMWDRLTKIFFGCIQESFEVVQFFSTQDHSKIVWKKDPDTGEITYSYSSKLRPV